MSDPIAKLSNLVARDEYWRARNIAYQDARRAYYSDSLNKRNSRSNLINALNSAINAIDMAEAYQAELEPTP
jgi:hypothetical protein